MGAVHRPISPAKYKKVYQLAASGATRTAIAQFLKVSRAHFYELIKTNPTLLEAVELGEAIDVSICKSVIRDRAMSSKNPGWMDRYLHYKHGIKHMNSSVQSVGGVVINLVMPFESGSKHLEQGITIDQEEAETDDL